MHYTKNNESYDEWVFKARWGKPGSEELRRHKDKRIPLSPKLKEERRKHMLLLYNNGINCNWIAKLYGLSRVQVRRIIKDIPNHL